MRRPPAAAALVAALLVTLAAAAHAGAGSPPLPMPWTGIESAAATDDAVGYLLNPAAGGLRYPLDLSLAWRQDGRAPDAGRAAFSRGGFGLGAEFDDEGAVRLPVGFAGGSEAVRAGATMSWLAPPGGKPWTVDARFGLLSRPAPWLSLGAVADHLAEPAFEGETLDREYTLAVGLRPLALDRARAYGLGPRLTLTADLVMREGGDPGASRVRIGGECELLPGLSLRGSADDHGDWRAGIALLGPRVTAHALADRREAGSPHAAAYGLQVHSADERTVLQPPGSRRVATLAVSGNLGDESLGGFSLLGGDATVSSSPLHAALERALEEPRVRGVLLELGGATGMAQLEELRPRLARLRATGKPVVAWLPWGAGRGDLYLAGACDRIVASPEGQFNQLGLRVEQRYYRRMLADLGLRLNRTSAGRYKSAGRNLTVDSTTAEDREAIERNLDVIQELFVSTFAADRRIARDSLLGVLDGRDWPAAELAVLRVLDAVGEREDALAALGGLAGLGAKPATVVATRLEGARRAWHVPARVAVVYASGGIELGRSGNDPLWGPTLGAATLVGQLESAFRDPGVRAVVLRIESPGGSALASDAMHRATVRLKRETGKPLVVSMGRTAASGGYHLAIDADRILADRFTRTGSIGVVFASPSLEGFYARRGVRQDVFQRGEWMGAFSPGKDWDPAFQASADSAIGRSYRSFVRKVAAGRKLSFEQADAVAQGRVWMGEDALARGLVDGLGGLEDAVAEARRRGGIPAGERIRLAEYRRPAGGFVERLIASSLRASWERHVGRLSLEEGPMYLAEPIDVE